MGLMATAVLIIMARTASTSTGTSGDRTMAAGSGEGETQAPTSSSSGCRSSSSTSSATHNRAVVLKKMVCPPAARHRFLRACSLCRRELSLNKEVYMYRGDQGFCSEECRRQQILTDQAREREATVVKRNRQGLPHHRRHHGQRLLPPAIVGAPRRLLAVA